MPLYEIERKFAFNLALLARFRMNQGQPPFHHLTYQRNECFEDEYFDSANLLSKSGVWIRKRDKIWEAKCRQDGDFLRSSFNETGKVDEIKKMIRTYAHVGYDVSPDNNFGLTRICRYRTKREIYLADDQFSIMLDSTDFGHWVGEVELQTHQSASALSDIDTFMQKYSWFFENGGTPKGKMTAYFELFGFPSELANSKDQCLLFEPAGWQ
ncbi:hypothetical protein BOTCAL_0590g00040 [Botryotinia calthae]|uniref:Uncharacterized protein n=1 Tax=Botryotinia calthae TaxID=38488 RepID=A0A4Y8CJR7_9HELO|nr:hypothetical protein BOTCAL_0590g00040 [Botryotinia calthae]